jgi:hypothetical protein
MFSRCDLSATRPDFAFATAHPASHYCSFDTLVKSGSDIRDALQIDT